MMTKMCSFKRRL